jgi:hypothetical protein
LLVYFVIGYLFVGIVSIFILAYDSFSNDFDFGFSGGWEFFWFQRYLIWASIIILAPISFVMGIYKHISDFPYAQKWKRDGSFTRKIK